MEQQPIDYRSIINLGFKEEILSDSTFFDEYGYQYTYVHFKLTKYIHIEWDKTTRFCKIVRYDKDNNIKGTILLGTLQAVKKFMEFYGHMTVDANSCA